MSAILSHVLALGVSGKYGICAGATLYFYDYLLTWAEEKKLIWEARLSYVKAIFLFIRSMGFTLTIMFLWRQFTTSGDDRSCGILYYFCMGGYISVAHASGLVLALRTWAIWERGFPVGVLMAVVWTSVTVVTTVFLVYTCIGVIPDGDLTVDLPLGAGSLTGCGPTIALQTAPWALRTFICLSAYEGFIFVMTVIRGLNYMYDAKPSGMTFVLYRDAFLSSFCLLALNIINAILNAQGNAWFYVPYHLAFTFYFIVPCRIVLNLREISVRGDAGWHEVTMGEPDREVIPLSRMTGSSY